MNPRGAVTYVSLTDIIAAFGGAMSINSERIQIDLSGGQAWLKLDQTSVNSSLDSFNLRQPVLLEGDDILVAATDVRGLLLKAFGVDSTQRVNRETAARTSPRGMSIDDITGARTPAGASSRPTRRPVSTEIRTAIIDPGHGGDDSGIEEGDVNEKDIALAVAVRVRSALEQAHGLKVRLSRDDDLRLSNPQRVTLANRDAGDVLISLHTGASRSGAARGFELFYSAPRPGLDAGAIAQSLSDALVKATGTPSLGVRQAKLSVFRDLEMPGILIEMGFLTNAAEVTQLTDETYQQKIADGIAAGLAAYVRASAPVAEAS